MNDFATRPDATTLRFERLLPGPIERVWAYLTDPDKRALWLAGGSTELRPGGEVHLLFRNNQLTRDDEPVPEKYADHADESHMHGRILAMDPPRLLRHTWSEGEDSVSEVTFELTPQGNDVLLVLTHSRVARHDHLVSFAGGWHTHLMVLTARLNEREPAGFWATFKRMEADYGQRFGTE